MCHYRRQERTAGLCQTEPVSFGGLSIVYVPLKQTQNIALVRKRSGFGSARLCAHAAALQLTLAAELAKSDRCCGSDGGGRQTRTGMEKVREIFDYLQDPLLVARFQHFCGVRGILTAGSWTTPEPSQAHQNGACLRHGFRGARSENAGEEKPVVGAQMTDTEPKRVARNGAPVPVSAALGEPTVTGTSRRVPDPSGRTVKPLRRNSLTGDVGQEFVIENRFLFFLFTFGTELGNELFYIIFFPFIMWNIDVLVGRRLVMVWVWVMYLGQCTKDLLRWSRPASPPVVKVEMFYNSEYSMPSTHAMSGTAIPFSLFFMTDGRWEYPSSLGFILALCWCLLVCSSRIYMGMHSVLDVIAGFLYTVLLLQFILPALEPVDTFNLTCHFAPLIIVFLHVGLGLLSFTLDTWSTSRGDTAQILGSGAGIALASHVNQRLGLIPDLRADQVPLTMPVLSSSLVGVAMLRFALGVLVLMVTRALMKAVTIPLVCWLVGVPGGDTRKARQHMEVELPYRYIVYGTMGFNVLFLVPLLFSFLQPGH